MSAPAYRLEYQQQPQPLAAALDVGVSKTVCLAARRDPILDLHPERPLRLLGVGAQSAPAIASGQPADFDACARAIRVAIDQAERMAGESIRSVTASYSGPGVSARIARGAVRVKSGIVTERDLRAALSAATASAPAPGRTILYAAPLRFRVDDQPPVSDALGLPGRMLIVEACVVSAPEANIEALAACIHEAGVEIDEIVAAPHAAGLGALTRDELRDGALVLDIGAGATGLAAFAVEGLVHAETLPLGGVRMTRDLARRLETTFAAAERAKLVYGLVGRNNCDPNETVEAPRLGPDGRLQAARALRGAIAEAMHPRFHEILLTARDRLASAGLTGAGGPGRAVIIGGCAMMPGARELASDILGMPVRIGQPFELCGFENGEAGPAYAAAAGVLRWRLEHADSDFAAQIPDASLADAARAMRTAAARAWGWLQRNF